ncbi:ABC transporter substrate-binding protein [Sulfurirhabdus autotrophica]|uniref:ABC-type uncharacterized transport system substrate-binding protein n=1 Tax=Sulfurirhabdus autotrophica TaxID=1706046 RepID=A0A4R3Y6A7_9PROT|nr:ABC transporter substrate binding protein [Sulfurirhabdus autotrophica]TCV87347.1 ABC-type uncharacterized transport system substrate-binding protein [Sulfurirhabdus autotrophica]
MSIFPNIAQAESRLLLLLSEKSGAYLEVAQAIQSGLKDRKSQLVVGMSDVEELVRSGMTIQPHLIVAIGVKAAEAAAHMDTHPPVLNLLVPKQSFERIAKSNSASEIQKFSAIYIDQPYSRQLDLIRVMFTDQRRVGVLYGPSSKGSINSLVSVARQKKLQIVAREIGAENELISVLKSLLTEVDVLLALPEPTVFNNMNIQGILLTTYRFGDPVIAFSPSYVRAGALAALYSSPDQVGTEAVDAIIKMVKGNSIVLPSPQYPQTFSISINRQVARSLGITVDEDSVLYEKLKKWVEQE